MMRQIQEFIGEELSRIATDIRYGLYLVRCVREPDIYRLGASGFKGGLAARLRHHRGGPPRDRKNPPNWTELMRPFRPVWAVHLADASDGSTKRCERYLQAKFSTRFKFVDESGFTAAGIPEDEIVEFARAQLEELRRLFEFQDGEFFKKLPKTGVRWSA